MTVDFERAKVRSTRAATVTWSGAWSDQRIRRELEGLAAWAAERGVRTGRWFFVAKSMTRFQVGIELRSPQHGSGRVRVRTYPATSVVRVAFDPDQVSPRIVYHGLTDYLRWRKRDGSVKSIGDYREVYDGNPWKDKAAWAGTRIEAIVRP